MLEPRHLLEISDRAWATEMKRRALAGGYTWGEVPVDYKAFRDAVHAQAPADLDALGFPHAYSQWPRVREALAAYTRQQIRDAQSHFDNVAICIYAAIVWARRGAPEAGVSVDDYREAQMRVAAADYDEIARELDRENE